MGNTALAISAAIELTTQLLKLQQTMAAAAAEGRDISKGELDVARSDTQEALDRLKATIDAME